MTIQEFLYKIMRLAGDADQNSLSTNMLLDYMFEESGAIASLFPRQESYEDSVVENSVTGPELDWLDPQFVYMDNTTCQKQFSTEVERIIVDPSLNHYTDVYWALTNSVLRVSSNGAVKIVGNWKPSGYAEEMLHYEMYDGLIYDQVEKKVPALTGQRLRALRYRMLSRAAEELGSFDKAQYFVTMGTRIERDLRNTINLESTTSTGFIYGCDF